MVYEFTEWVVVECLVFSVIMMHSASAFSKSLTLSMLAFMSHTY